MKLPTIKLSQVALAIPILGTLIFYTWQPISDYFFTHSFDENILLTMEYEDIKIDSENRLLIIHAKPSNRGNVPVELTKDEKKATLIIEVRKVGNIDSLKWIDKEKLELVNKIDVLAKFNDGYLIEPNAFYDEVEAIKLPLGTYWVKATLNFNNTEFVDSNMVVNLVDEKSQSK